MTSLVEVIGIAGRRAQGYVHGASRSVPSLRQEARLALVVRLRDDKFKNNAKRALKRGVTFGNFFASRNFLVPLRHKSHKTSRSVTNLEMNESRNVFVPVTFALSQNQLLLLATIAATKKLRDMFISGHVSVGDDSCNVCHNNTSPDLVTLNN